MKTNKLVLALISTLFAVNTHAAPPPKPAQDVNVVNTPSVTVANPQTTVTVDNGAGSPVPVTGSMTVDNTSPIPVTMQGGSTTEYEFVGYSSENVNVSTLGYQSLVCRNTFGPLARWARSSEVREAFESGSFTELPSAIATVRAEYSHVVWDDINHRMVHYDPYADFDFTNAGCGGGKNLTVVLTTLGRFSVSSCYATANNIIAACSLPKQ